MIIDVGCMRNRSEMVVFSVTFVRHGETLYNKRNIIQGQIDVPLSNVGQQQAKLVAGRLENDCFTHIFSSDLARAHQTAQAIIEANKMRKCPIMKDKRLRERKFGVFEGKTSKEFLAAAKKSNISVPHYTPQGAETITQLAERAKSFFRDLCKLLAAFINDTEDSEYTPGSIKRRHGGSLGRNSHHARNRLNNSHRSQSFCGIASITDLSEHDIYLDQFSSDQKRRKHEKRSCDQNCNDENNPDVIPTHQNDFSNIIPTHQNDFSIEIINGSEYSNKCKYKSELPDHTVPTELSEAPLERSGSNSSSGYSSLPESLDLDDEELETVRYRKLHSDKQQLSDSSCVLNKTDLYDPLHHEICPNVTLSPMLSHRLSSVSSISSGRNSSFDDVDGLPPTIADVLVVTHGGLLKEMIRYLVEDLDCKIPNKGHALRICPNCSISKFIVNLQDGLDSPAISCVLLHDKDHLLEMECSDAEGKY